MLSYARFNPNDHECIFIGVGEKIASEQDGARIRVVFNLACEADVDRAEEALRLYRELLRMQSVTKPEDGGR